MALLKEFRDFAVRGNVLDLAVAVIVGAAFGPIVNSLVNDIIMPPIGLVLGRVDFASLFINLTPDKYNGGSLADAKKAGAAVIAYGQFISTVINFLIIAFIVFLMVKQVSRFRPAAPAPATRECPYCLGAIPVQATRCAHCTSQVPAA